MSFRDLARKYQKMIEAKTNVTTMIWVDSIEHLTPDQLDSKNEIYIYLEI